MECLGCRIANGSEPNVNIIYENELVTCVLDIDPFNEGHTLIFPKSTVWISTRWIKKLLMPSWMLLES